MSKSLAAAAALIAAPAAASEPATELAGGIHYQTGKYGTGERVEVLSAPVSLQHRRGRVTVAASVPFQRVEGPSNAIGGGGFLGLSIIVDPSRPAGRSVRQGVGDARIAATYTIPREAMGGVALALTGQVKLPTASTAKGLGTGKTDYALGAEVSTRIGRVVPFAAVGYTLPGDPDGLKLRNSHSARAGALVGLSQRTEAQLAYEHARSVSRLLPNEQQITTAVATSLSQRVSLGVQAAAGLSDGSPRLAAGLRLGLKL